MTIADLIFQTFFAAGLLFALALGVEALIEWWRARR